MEGRRAEHVEAETLALATRLAAKPQQALKIARDLVRGNRDEIMARIEEEGRHFVAQLQSAEARAAFEPSCVVKPQEDDKSLSAGSAPQVSLPAGEKKQSASSSV